MPPPDDAAIATDLRIIRARDPQVLEAARTYLMWRTEADYGYGHVPEWHRDIDDAYGTYVATDRQSLWVALAPTSAPAHPLSSRKPLSHSNTTPEPGELSEILPGRDRRERIVGTVAIRTGGPKVPPHPPMLAERYPDPNNVAQLVRLMVAPEFRRQGLAGTLTDLAVNFAKEAGYTSIYLHTNALVPGALEFWRRHAVEICDARGTEYDTDPRFETVHFEIPA